MSAELIEYLIEYCVENGHKSMHYIRKVALSWNEQKIDRIRRFSGSLFPAFFFLHILGVQRVDILTAADIFIEPVLEYSSDDAYL